MVELSLVEYSERAFVITGEDTRKYKEDLKNLGGKWNSRLTDKKTGEKFCGWVFYVSLREKVEEWLKSPTSVERKEYNNTDSNYKSLEKRVEKLENLVRELSKKLESFEDIESDESGAESYPMKRLL